MYTKNGVIRSTPFETIYWQSLPWKLSKKKN
jgi:hypothetical protein